MRIWLRFTYLSPIGIDAPQGADAQPMHDSLAVDVSRRNVLRTSGGALTLATGGALVAFGSSGTASASVEATELGIPPASHEGKDGTVASIELSVSGNYQFTTEGADSIIVSLMVASAPDKSDWGVIDQHQESVLAASSAGPYSLAGDILSHDQLEASRFSADPSETVAREVPVRVILDVIKGGENVVTATAETVAEIEVTSTAVAVSAELSGSGNVEIAV